MSDTPRVDREVYTVSEKDIGFQVVGVELAKILERELAVATQALVNQQQCILEDHDPDSDEILSFRTPRERREAGERYCPKCLTFGADHRRNCPFKGVGTANHISRPRSPSDSI